MSNKTNQHRVFAGDVIKFGRVRFRIKKLVIDPSFIEDGRNNGAPEEDDDHNESLPTRSNALND